MTNRVLRSVVAGICILICAFVPFAVEAQTQAAPADESSSEQLLGSGELEALVAPIALYPDPLLAIVLMASTYPLEIVQADRWLSANKNLTEGKLKSAVDSQAWDASVKALTATPSVLKMMSDKLDWTQKLGDAVLAQQADVMDAIQQLRSKAQANNKLTTTKEQTVTVTQQDNKQYIAIEPTNPETVYVPAYDPSVVYGDWSYPDYPPYYFPPAPYLGYGVISAGIAFGAGYLLGSWTNGGNYWGGGIHWNGGGINVNRPVVNPLGGNNWQHNPQHRGGVRYNNANVERKFGNARAGRSGSNFKGRGGRQGLNAGGNRPSASNPGNRGNRANVSHHRSTTRNTSHANKAHRGARQANRPHARPSNVHRGHMGGAGRAHFGGRSHFGGGRGFGGRGGGGGRGGRRSDIRLKHDIVLLGYLDNGLGFYRFSYIGSNKAYVGVMAQEVQKIMPEAIVRDPDGYLSVRYDKLGIKFESYKQWVVSGTRLPITK